MRRLPCSNAARAAWLASALVALAACGDGAVSSAAGAGGAPAASSVASTIAVSPVTSSSASSSTGTGGSAACILLTEELQGALDSIVASTGAPGGVLSATTAACGTWSGASGTSTPTEPMTPKLALGMGSVTKTFVAAAVLDVVKDGLIDLDGPLSDWEPDFPDATAITIRMLLNHTSGIFSFTEDTSFTTDLGMTPGRVWSPQELVDIAAMDPPYFAPGQGWQYSNTDYILLGIVLEAATGMKVGPIIRSRFLDPLGLTSTSFAGEEPVIGELAHTWAEGQDFTGVVDWSIGWTAGAMVTTAADLSAWAQALYGGDAIDAASLAEMMTSVPTDTPSWGYGLGVIVMDASYENAVGHNGAFPFYQSWMLYFPNTKASFALMLNTYPTDPSAIDAIVPPMVTLLGTP